MSDPYAPAKLTIAPRHLLILLVPMLVVTGSEAILSAFADPNIDLGTVSIIDAPKLAELTGRYRFLAVFFFYVAITLTILAIFGAELFSRHTRTSIIYVILGLIGLVAFSSLFSLVEPEWMGSFEAYELLGASLFETSLSSGDMPICDTGVCGETGAFFAMRLLMNTTNILSALAVSAVILGMIVALSRIRPIDLSTKAGIASEAKTLAEAQKAVKRYLYLSGVVLSSGMMLGYAWMLWPAALLADGTQASDYGDLVQSISLYRGVSYTVLILSFYMPVSLIQMVRIERLHAAAQDTEMQDLADSIQGFDIERIGSLDAFKAMLSIMSPILASAVGSFTGINVLG